MSAAERAEKRAHSEENGEDEVVTTKQSKVEDLKNKNKGMLLCYIELVSLLVQDSSHNGSYKRVNNT